MRTLAVNIGNTSLFAGVFEGERCRATFRLSRSGVAELPRHVKGAFDRAVMCSVVPALTARVRRLIRRTWGVEPHVLNALSEHGLTIGYERPRDLGADRVAAALGARALFGNRNIIVVDCGTATTLTVVDAAGAVRGGAIFPGVSLWPELLVQRTAQLPRAEVTRPRRAIGRSPAEAIASGCYHGHLGAIREAVARVRREAFGRQAAVVVGTGGHAPLFRPEKLFTRIEPALVLIGLQRFGARQAALENRTESR